MDMSILDHLSEIKKIQKNVQGMKLGKCEVESISRDKVLFSVSFSESASDRIVVKGFSER